MSSDIMFISMVIMIAYFVFQISIYKNVIDEEKRKRKELEKQLEFQQNNPDIIKTLFKIWQDGRKHK
jgi:hypothetical protein